MTETAKTFTFVGIGIAAIAVALLTRPSSAELDVKSLVGEVLTEKFTSPEDAKRLRIVRVDEDTATLSTFEVAERDGVWTLPSKDGYPADATRQMAQAATSLMDRRILEVKGDNAADHADYGVLDPLSPNLRVGQTGVGMRITAFDAHDAPLADLIVGKEPRNAAGQRYVREASKNLVYVIEIDPSHLSTNFADWIEKDLLKLNPWDLQQVQIKDYSAVVDRALTLDGRIVPTQIVWDPRSEMTLAYNDRDAKWSAVQLRKFDRQQGANGEHVDFTLAEDEELNNTALNALKDALDDLAIVDVVHKPSGLSNDLKAGADFLNNREALESLLMRGFVSLPRDGGEPEIISSDGEVIATMKNGTEYVLRFGDLKRVTAAQQEADKADAAEGDAPSGKEGIHRYLFVMARFNESAVKQPELEVPPDLPAAGGGEVPRDAGAATDDGEAATNESASAEVGVPPVAPQVEGQSTPDQPATSQSADAAKTGAGEVAQPTGQSGTDEAAQKTEPAGGTSDLDKAVAERKRIEADNQRKLSEYEETLKKGRENVKQLNDRFSDWYFVVADDVFSKIRLGRDAVVKKKDPKDAAGKSAPTGGPSSTERNDGAASEYGAPGTSIPGLPEIPKTDRE